MRHLLPLAAVLALLAACQAAPAPEPLSGTWGGDHVRLTFSASGAALEYDCASGVIEGQVIPDGDGRFSASGTHSPGQGGPVREGEAPPRLPAEYTGRVRGGRMTLNVAMLEHSLGPLTLERDATPRLFRCL